MLDVSVVVITYNHEKYISQALESVLMQKWTGTWEVLVGDDASADGTSQILKHYEEAYPELIRVCSNRQNQGASRNLYEMLCRAKGKYIALLEGDDYWTDSDKLRKQVEWLERHKEYSACTHECEIVDVEGNPLKKQYKYWLSHKRIFTLKDCQGFYLSGQTGTLLMRNYFLENPQMFSILYQAHPMISDRTLQTILSAILPIYHMPEKMSAYRQNIRRDGTNATSVLFVENIESPYENLKLTICLEQYIADAFHKKLMCDSIKRMFLAIGCLKAARYPDKAHKEVLKKMMNVGKISYFQLAACLPIECMKRVYIKLMEG